jgi:hypothetical protein
VDWTTFGEFVSPLAVSIFAVWLGFRYQRVLAETHSRREAWVRIFAHLNRMMDSVEQVERLSFVCLLVAEIDEKIEDPAIRGDSVRFVTLAIVDLCSTVARDQPWFQLLQQGEEGVAKLAHSYPPYLRALIHARFEEERRQVRDEMPHLVLARPLLLRDRKGVRLFQAAEALEFRLSGVFHAIQPNVPAKVDWKPITELVLAVQAAAAKDLGYREPPKLGMVQFREGLPWPPDTPTVKADMSRTREEMASEIGLTK